MKTSSILALAITTLAVEISLVSAHAADATNATAAVSSSQKSVFTVPRSKSDGCDPFFPGSTRLWGVTVVATPTATKSKPSGLDCLALKGLSGTAAEPLAMINGRTMSKGEEAEINTPCGKISVHCVDITNTNAIIEVAGERKELRLRSDF